MDPKLREQYQEVLARQVPVVRSEVENLGVRISSLADSLQVTHGEGSRLLSDITSMRLDQDSFHERVEKVGRALRQCKQILEGFNS